MARYSLHSLDATQRIASEFASTLNDGDVVYFHGEMGMGKTTFIRYLLRALGVEGTIKSPTYTIVEPYAVGARQYFHFDLYRISEPEELEAMGIREYFEGKNVALIEWPSLGEGVIADASQVVVLGMEGDMRFVEINEQLVR